MSDSTPPPPPPPPPEETSQSLQNLNKEIDVFSTDPALIGEIDKDYLEVMNEFSGDPDLELFKIKYETIYNSLKESHENETRWIKKCKEHNSEINLYAGKVQNALKTAQDDETQIELYRKELAEVDKKIDDTKRREKELNEKITLFKNELGEVRMLLILKKKFTFLKLKMNLYFILK